MKKIFAIAIIIIIVFSLQGCGTSQSNVNETDGVVLTLDDKQGCATSRDNVNEIDGVVITLDDEQGWKPDESIIDEFEEKLITFVNNFKSRDGDEDSLEFVKKNITKYKRQYIGKIIDERKVLFCNFLLIDEEDDHLSDWKTKYILVRDGGPRYFRVNYDVENKTLFDFSINCNA